MKLEDSNGRTSEPKGVSEITDMIGRLGKGLDHCILSDGNLFIQAAGADPKLVVEYGDPSGHFEAASVLPAETVKGIFTAFFQNDPSWKKMAVFTRAGEGASPSGGAIPGGSIPGAASNRSTPAGAREKGLKDDLINSVKGEVRYGFSGVIRRIVRGIFRSF